MLLFWVLFYFYLLIVVFSFDLLVIFLFVDCHILLKLLFVLHTYIHIVYWLFSFCILFVLFIFVDCYIHFWLIIYSRLKWCGVISEYRKPRPGTVAFWAYGDEAWVVFGLSLLIVIFTFDWLFIAGWSDAVWFRSIGSPGRGRWCFGLTAMKREWCLVFLKVLGSSCDGFWGDGENNGGQSQLSWLLIVVF